MFYCTTAHVSCAASLFRCDVQHMAVRSLCGSLRRGRVVAPDARALVPTARPEVVGAAGGDRDNRVLVPLQHHLRLVLQCVPEEHSAVFAARHQIAPVGRVADAQHIVLLIA